ncbi:MAG: hypothetical protein AAFP76_12145 [Bacteroidota bacterium]
MKHEESNKKEISNRTDDVYARAIKEAIARQLASINFRTFQEAS